MRIAIVASARHPIREPFAGGLEMHTYALATTLRSRGHDVTVFASGDSDPELGVEPVCPEASRLELSPEAESDLSMLSQRFLEEHHAYLRLMLHLREREFDLVQNSSLHYLPVAMASALAPQVVTTLHTPPTPWLESAVGAAPDCDGATFVSVSESNAAAWAHRVRVEAVIPNGVDLEEWPFRDDPEPDLAVWTGRVVPEKGTHLAVDAAHAAGMRIVVAGPTRPGDYLESEVLPRLQDGDEYVGHLTQRDLAEVVGGAAVQLCTPCWDEPFGLVIPEALACGTPVAAFARGALPELVGDETGRLAPSGDVEALGQAAREATELERSACRRRADKDFSLGVMVDRYEALYERLGAVAAA